MPRLLDTVPFETSGHVEMYAMDQWLDHLETVATALSQRRMTEDQRERLYRLLERIYTDARTRRHSRKVKAA